VWIMSHGDHHRAKSSVQSSFVDRLRGLRVDSSELHASRSAPARSQQRSDGLEPRTREALAQSIRICVQQSETRRFTHDLAALQKDRETALIESICDSVDQAFRNFLEVSSSNAESTQQANSRAPSLADELRTIAALLAFVKVQESSSRDEGNVLRERQISVGHRRSATAGDIQTLRRRKSSSFRHGDTTNNMREDSFATESTISDPAWMNKSTPQKSKRLARTKSKFHIPLALRNAMKKKNGEPDSDGSPSSSVTQTRSRDRAAGSSSSWEPDDEVQSRSSGDGDDNSDNDADRRDQNFSDMDESGTHAGWLQEKEAAEFALDGGRTRVNANSTMSETTSHAVEQRAWRVARCLSRGKLHGKWNTNSHARPFSSCECVSPKCSVAIVQKRINFAVAAMFAVLSTLLCAHDLREQIDLKQLIREVRPHMV